MQYTFTGEPHHIISKPHGNSKAALPYIRTTPSTLQKLKESYKKHSSKRIIFDLVKEKGGVQKLSAAGDIPRNQKQVYNLSNKKSLKDDALLSVMVMCKEGQGKGADQAFVGIVTSAPEPMSVLCTNSQLFDIQRFCTDACTSYPLSIDPTFDLGDFSVTVTSYRNLMLKSCRTNKNPVMLGPMMVHRCKFFSSYHFFASSLISLNPSLIQLRAFGTDGEEGLYKAFATQFPSAAHLRCFLHFRDNCKTKLQQLHVSNDVVLDIIQDILGSYLKGKPGLVDMNNVADLQSKFMSLKEKWDKEAPGFFDWFLKNKLMTVESCMLKPVREFAGLGSPPDPFYTNDVESANRIIKRKTDYKASEWPEFCKLAKELIEEQENEIEKAIIGVGEYKFNDDYAHLAIPLGKWSSMSQLQRKKHIDKIKSLTLQEAKTYGKPKVSKANESIASSHSSLSICGNTFFADKCQLSEDILYNIFSKAEKLVCSATSICQSPGSTDARLVESKSGQRPHFVVKTRNSKYNCDADCPMWKCSKLCSHTVACAYLDGCLQEFLNVITDAPSFYALSKCGTPAQAGKKAHKRKACTKSAAKALTNLQDEISSQLHAVSSSISSNTCSLSTSIAGKFSNASEVSSLEATPAPLKQTQIIQSPCISVTQNLGGNNNTTTETTVILSSAPCVVQSPSISVTQSITGSNSVMRSSSSCAITDSNFQSATANKVPAINTSQEMTYNSLLSALILHLAKGATQQGTMHQPQVPTSSSVAANVGHLFYIMYISGNISRCQGCSGKILRTSTGKPLPPPDDLVVQHKEQVLFQNQKTGNFQLSHDFRNVYYHPRLSCIKRKFPSFLATQHLRINPDVATMLTSVHKNHLFQEFQFQL